MTAHTPAAGGHGTPTPVEEGVSRFTEEVVQEAFSDVGRATAHDAHGRWALHMALAMKRFPGGKIALKALVRAVTGPVAKALGRGAAKVFANGDTQVAGYINDLFENPATGFLWGIIDSLDALTEQQIAEALEKNMKNDHGLSKTAVAEGVPAEVQKYAYIEGPSPYGTDFFVEVDFKSDATVDFRDPRPGVEDDLKIPRTRTRDFNARVDTYMLDHRPRKVTVSEESGGGKGARPTKKSTDKLVPSDVVLQIRYGDALTMQKMVERGAIVPHPDITDWHERVKEARKAAHAKAGDHEADDHGHEKKTEEKPKQTLMMLAREGEYPNVINVLNALARTPLGWFQQKRKTDLFGDVERAGIEEGVFEEFDAFCAEYAHKRELAPDEVDAILTWVDDNIPGVQEDLTTGGWRTLWLGQRGVGRLFTWARRNLGFALLALVVAFVLVAGLVYLVWSYFVGLVWKFFTGAFAAASVDTANPGSWAYERLVDMFKWMVGGGTIDHTLYNILMGDGIMFLLAILCTVISVFGQAILNGLREVPIVGRLIPKGDEAFRNVGRDCAQFLAEFAALYTILVMFWIPPAVAVITVTALICVSFGARMAYRSQGHMEATIRDNLRQTHQFLMFRLTAVFVAQVILRFVFPGVLTSLRVQMEAFIGTNGILFLSLVALSAAWVWLTMRSTATPEERASSNMMAGWAAALVVLIVLAPPVWNEAKSSTAGAWTHFWNPSGSWKRSVASGGNTSASHVTNVSRSGATQDASAHSPKPSADPGALTHYCDGVKAKNPALWQKIPKCHGN